MYTKNIPIIIYTHDRVREFVLRRMNVNRFSIFSPSAAEVVTGVGYVGGPGTEDTEKTIHNHGKKILRIQQETRVSIPLPQPQKINSSCRLVIHCSSWSHKEVATIRKKIRASWAEEWSSSKTGETTRSFFPRPECRESINMVSIPHQVVQVLTGHSFLNAHQHRFGFSGNPNSICSPTPETVEHFIFHCPLFYQQREEFRSACLESFDRWPPTLESLHKFPPIFRKMSSFIRRTHRLESLARPRSAPSQQPDSGWTSAPYKAWSFCFSNICHVHSPLSSSPTPFSLLSFLFFNKLSISLLRIFNFRYQWSYFNMLSHSQCNISAIKHKTWHYTHTHPSYCIPRCDTHLPTTSPVFILYQVPLYSQESGRGFNKRPRKSRTRTVPQADDIRADSTPRLSPQRSQSNVLQISYNRKRN